jgi:hypothetical protein
MPGLARPLLMRLQDGNERRSMRKLPIARRSRAPQALYANYFEVGHSSLEFMVDLGQYDPDLDGCRLHTRIVTGPVYAKLLMSLLGDAIRQYEAEYGEIRGTDEDLDPLEIVKNSIVDFDPFHVANQRK